MAGSTAGTTDTGAAGNGAAGASGGTGGSGESGGAGGGTGGQAEAGTDGDANPPAPGTMSNLPGVDFQVSTMGAATGLSIVTSNLTQDTNGLVYVEWFAEVKNSGAKPVCLAHVKVTFESTTGGIVESLDGYAAADPYKAGSSTLSSGCIAPGKTGVVWTNDLPSTAISLQSIKTAKVTIDASSAFDGAVPHPMAPTVSGAAITPHSTLSSEWSVSGQATAIANIYNVKEDVYVIDAAGFAVDNLGAFHLDTFFQGDTWKFETITGYQGAKPANFRMFASFIEGVKTSAADFAAPEGPASFGSFAERELTLRRAHDEVRARRDQAKLARSSRQP
jgi:hypothetical protein